MKLKSTRFFELVSLKKKTSKLKKRGKNEP